MTIAIGYHCYGGVVVAADTALVVGEVESQEGSKLDTFYAKSGIFAIVNASADGNATATLVRDVQFDLSAANLATRRDFETIIKRRMTEWRHGFGKRKAPGTQLIVAARVQSREAALYFCEPPHTVREVDNYVAAGWGAAVTDPLQQMLFEDYGGEYVDVQLLLRRIAYLMYRAKKDNIYCGKDTQAAIVASGLKDGLIEVDREDMRVLEGLMKELDILLSSAAIFALESREEAIKGRASELGDMLLSLQPIRSFVFRDHHGDEIRL